MYGFRTGAEMKYISVGLAVVFLGLQYQIWFHNKGLRSQYSEMRQKAQSTEEQNRRLAQRNQALKTMRLIG